VWSLCFEFITFDLFRAHWADLFFTKRLFGISIIFDFSDHLIKEIFLLLYSTFAITRFQFFSWLRMLFGARSWFSSVFFIKFDQFLEVSVFTCILMSGKEVFLITNSIFMSCCWWASMGLLCIETFLCTHWCSCLIFTFVRYIVVHNLPLIWPFNN
jgi:hypothetical protein